VSILSNPLCVAGFVVEKIKYAEGLVLAIADSLSLAGDCQ
jgi:hypothetical protein